jgi:tetratricopeptide (TPR) repeat protein
MMKTKGGLISFNNFLSSSKKPNIALIYAQRALINSDSVGIVFQMIINPSISKTPFALIDEHSFFKQSEQEVLFAMHTVFRIGEMKLTDDKSNRLWEVELTLTSDNDQQLNALTRRMREETQGTKGWYRLGQLLIKLGRFDKAEELYKILLTHKCDENKKGCIYHQLGYIKDNLGDYAAAISFHERSLAIEEKLRSSNHRELATSYDNIGLVYVKMGEYAKALSFHKQALRIYQTALSPNNPESATSLNNIGFVYYKMEDYSAALASHQKALEIYKETLPPNHPSLATSYHNIGLVHDGLSDYSRVLWFYNKTLEIYQKTLPPHHPDIAISYQTIGQAVEKMCEYSKALSYHHRALEIFQNNFPSNHPRLASCYSCIASVHNNMGDYSTALSFLRKSTWYP